MSLSVGSLHAQSAITIKGTVTDTDGMVLPGASVLEKGTANGSTTDFDGNYTITLPSKSTLVFSYVGYEPKEIVVNNQAIINAVLAPGNQLDEVVLVGYGSQRKSDLTGALVSVSSKDFKDQPITRVDQALQGRAAGVQVSQTNGGPGSGFKIRIRGANSILGNNNPLYVVDGLVVSDINSINVNDIKSMEILKDASATAIYGSRGANGVVLIATKTGKLGTTKITFDSFYSTQSVRKKLDILNGADFAETVNASRIDVGANAPFSASQISELRANGGTDWQDEIFRAAPLQNYQLGFSGANENTDFYISGNFLNQSGFVINQDYKRYSLRSNINTKVNDELTLGLNLYVSREERDGVAADVHNAVTWNPASPIVDENGNYILTGGYASIKPNPVADAREISREGNDHSVIANSYFQYSIIEGLTLKVSGGVEYLNTSNKTYAPSIINQLGIGAIVNGDVLRLQNTNVLTYSIELNTDNRLQVDFINEQQSVTTNRNESKGSNFPTDATGFKDLSLAENQTVASNSFSEQLVSYAGRINYSLFNKFLFTGTIRTDGSSKFRKDNRWGVFPSGSFAWKLSEENFIKNTHFFNSLKLRLGYGITGSQAVDALATRGRLGTGAAVNYPIDNGGFAIGIAPSSRLSNPNLSWEETKQFNIGFDTAILDNALTLSVDLYKKNTTDLLLDVPLPNFTGVSVVTKNIGEVENKGIDISLGFTPIKNTNFTWDSNVTFSLNKNKVLDLGGVNSILPGINYLEGATGGELASIVEVGKSLGQLRGYTFEGVYQIGEEAEAAVFGKVPGDSKYKDLDGDNVITTNDITSIGNGLPDFSWGLNSTLSYKNLDLNFLIQGSHGADVYNFTRGLQFGVGGEVPDPVHADILKRWTPTNPSNNTPAFSTTSQDFLLSTRFLEKGSFVRMKNITVAYNLPSSTLDSIGINALKMYVSAENLFTITNYSGFDPELSAAGNSDIDTGIDRTPYPAAKVFTLGFNLQF